jgi:hypothetical protein
MTDVRLRLARAWARAGVAICVGGALLSAVTAQGDATPEAVPVIETAVVPPGQDALFAAMLGRGAALPDDCTFRTGQIERSVVRGEYDCRGGAVVLELRHPSEAPTSARQTEKFALVPVRGTPPAALLAGVEERVRQREGTFDWLVPKVPTIVEPTVSVRQCVSPATLPSFLEPYFPACYPRVATVLIGIAQTSVILLGLSYGLLQLYRTNWR